MTKILDLFNKPDVWQWCSENDIWHPLPNLHLSIDRYVNFDRSTWISIPLDREVVRIGEMISLKIYLREIGKLPFFMDFSNDPKKRIDTKNLIPYDGYLIFDLEEE